VAVPAASNSKSVSKPNYFSPSRDLADTIRKYSCVPGRDADRSGTLLRTLRGILALTALALAASACLPLGESESVWGLGGASDDTFTLAVENRNYNSARLFAHWNGQRQRIGSVGGNQTETFTLDWRTRDFRVEVDFLAGGGFISDPISVNRGDNLIFRIPARAR